MVKNGFKPASNTSAGSRRADTAKKPGGTRKNRKDHEKITFIKNIRSFL